MSRNTQQAAIERYDTLVLSSGEAGKYITWTLAKEGRRAAGVERGLSADARRGSRPRISAQEHHPMKIAANDTALVVTGPQNDVLSETGIAAGLASNSIHAQGGPL